MKNNKEHLDGIVSKLKEQGINAGETEKQRIIEAAKKQANELIAKAQSESKTIIDDAKNQASQVERNAQAAISQASRDMIEATKVAILKHLKTVFGQQTESVFSQKQYLHEITKAVVESIQGDKTVAVQSQMVKDLEAFLIQQALSDKIELNVLKESEAKIVVQSSGKGIEYVLSAKDVEDGLFALLNKDLVTRITQKMED